MLTQVGDWLLIQCGEPDSLSVSFPLGVWNSAVLTFGKVESQEAEQEEGEELEFDEEEEDWDDPENYDDDVEVPLEGAEDFLWDDDESGGDDDAPDVGGARVTHAPEILDEEEDEEPDAATKDKMKVCKHARHQPMCVGRIKYS